MTTTWTKADTVSPRQRPGGYINFTKKSSALIQGGVAGIVAAVIRAPWGPIDRVVEIKTRDDIRDIFTLDSSEFEGATGIDNSYTAAFALSNLLEGGVSKILACRVVGPAPLKGTLVLGDLAGTVTGMVTIEAKYPGVYDGILTIDISDVVGGNKQQITLKKGTTVLRTFVSTLDKGDDAFLEDIVNIINNDRFNDWIVISRNPAYTVNVATGTHTFAIISDGVLSGGDGDEKDVTMTEYDVAQTLLEQENFELLYLDNGSTAVVNDYQIWVNERRNLGKRFTLITGSTLGETPSVSSIRAKGIGVPHVVYVSPGYKETIPAVGPYQRDIEETYPGYLVASKVAGIIAGIPLSSSPTFQQIKGITDLERRFTSEEVGDLLESGVLPLVWDGARYKIEKGINTLIQDGFGADYNEYYTKIKTLRILDNINNEMKMIIDENFIGRVPNDEDGLDDILIFSRHYLSTKSTARLILNNYTAEIDPNFEATLDSAFLLIGLQPIDSVDFLYMTIRVGQ